MTDKKISSGVYKLIEWGDLPESALESPIIDLISSELKDGGIEGKNSHLDNIVKILINNQMDTHPNARKVALMLACNLYENIKRILIQNKSIDVNDEILNNNIANIKSMLEELK